MAFIVGFSPVAATDVQGPGSATDNAVARFDGVTGKIIQNSGVIIDDSDNITGVASLTVTTLIASTTITTGDNIIMLNDDVTGTPTENAGLEVERGTSTNARLLWDEAGDYWTAGSTGQLPLALAAEAVTDNAVARWSGITHELENTGVLVDDSDNVTMPSDLTVDTTTLFVDASNSTVGIGTATPDAGGKLQIAHTITDNTQIIEGIQNTVNVTDTVNHVFKRYGWWSYLTNTVNSGITNSGMAIGFSSAAELVGTGSIDRVYGADINGFGTAASTVTTLYGANILYGISNASSTVTTSYGLYLNDIGTGTIANQYGIWQSGASSANHFDGPIDTDGTCTVGTDIVIKGDEKTVQFGERSVAPTTPVTGTWKIYGKSGGIYQIDDAGTETLLGGAGDVVGPGSSTDNAIARFDSTTGKLIQNTSTTTVDDSGNITTSNSLVGSAVQVIIENSDNTNVGSHASITLEAGGDSSGDPYINFRTNDTAATTSMSLGVDNSDSDLFKLTDASDLNSGNILLSITKTTGDASFIGDIATTVTTSVISSPGLGTSSEKFGVGTSAVGSNSLAVGISASSAGSSSTALGGFSSASSSDSTALGVSASASSNPSTAIGKSSSASGSSSVALGKSATASASNTFAVGTDSIASATYCIAIGGTSASATHTACVVIGQSATSTATNQFLVGSSVAPIKDVYLGTGVTSASAGTDAVSYNGTGGSGTDIGGASLSITGGRGTGTGAGGAITIKTAPAGSTGSSLNALVDRVKFNETSDAIFNDSSADYSFKFKGQAYFAETTLTDAANIAWDLTLNQASTVTLAGNRTLDNPTNLKAGASYTVIVKQDATGSRTLVYGTVYKWPGGTAPTLSTAASSIDILTFVSDGTNMYGVSQLAFA